MSLIIETGAIVPNADSFITVADAKTKAAAFGLTLTGTDPAIEVHLRNAYQYLMLFERRIGGSRINAVQTGIFPRNFCYNVYGFLIASDVVPEQAINAQVAIAAEMSGGTDLRPTNEYAGIQSERLEGVLSTTYNANARFGATVAVTKAIDFLRPLLKVSSGVIRG